MNIARATFFITLFGVYTGAMAIDQVEGRGTVSFVLGLTVITFKYSVMTGDHTPMPPALLEETDLDNFMDTGFNVLIIIIMENLICGTGTIPLALHLIEGITSGGGHQCPDMVASKLSLLC